MIESLKRMFKAFFILINDKILLILILIASVYGMNVPNDLEDNRYGIWIVISVSVLLSAFGVFLFKRKRWF